MTTVRRPVKRGNPDPAEASLERTLDGSFAWTCPPAHQAFPDITSKTYGACFLLPFSYSFVNLFFMWLWSRSRMLMWAKTGLKKYIYVSFQLVSCSCSFFFVVVVVLLLFFSSFLLPINLPLFSLFSFLMILIFPVLFVLFLYLLFFFFYFSYILLFPPFLRFSHFFFFFLSPSHEDDGNFCGGRLYSIFTDCPELNIKCTSSTFYTIHFHRHSCHCYLPPYIFIYLYIHLLDSCSRASVVCPGLLMVRASFFS